MDFTWNLVQRFFLNFQYNKSENLRKCFLGIFWKFSVSAMTTLYWLNYYTEVVSYKIQTTGFSYCSMIENLVIWAWGIIQHKKNKAISKSPFCWSTFNLEWKVEVFDAYVHFYYKVAVKILTATNVTLNSFKEKK